MLTPLQILIFGGGFWLAMSLAGCLVLGLGALVDRALAGALR